MERKKEMISIRCPQCGSEEIFKQKISHKVFAISFLLLGFPLPFISRTYHCFECNIDFKLKPKEPENDKPKNMYDP